VAAVVSAPLARLELVVLAVAVTEAQMLTVARGLQIVAAAVAVLALVAAV
jgi:hypothetical protein